MLDALHARFGRAHADHAAHGRPGAALVFEGLTARLAADRPRLLRGAGRRYGRRVIVWLNGTHGVGKSTAAGLVQQLIPDSRVLDAEKVGETLMDVRPALPALGDFQHWPPWRPLVVETARRLIEYTGGTLVMPMTVLVEAYWREIHDGLAHHGIPVRHVVLHAEEAVLRRRIEGDVVLGPSDFRVSRLAPYAAALRTWLREEAEVVDTSSLTPGEVARRIAGTVAS